MDKEREIIDFAEDFLNILSRKCLLNCGRIMSPVQLPVFRKFLSYRTRREMQYNKLCLDTAAVLNEADFDISDEDVDEIVEESMDIDNRLTRDIRLLPIRLSYDYDKLLPFRKERSRKNTYLFKRLLASDSASEYAEMARKSFQRGEYIDINKEILELYAEEALIINSAIKSLIKIDMQKVALMMYSRMIEVGNELNQEIADGFWGPE